MSRLKNVEIRFKNFFFKFFKTQQNFFFDSIAIEFLSNTYTHFHLFLIAARYRR